jgi:hypothetical protein
MAKPTQPALCVKCHLGPTEAEKYAQRRLAASLGGIARQATGVDRRFAAALAEIRRRRAA